MKRLYLASLLGLMAITGPADARAAGPKANAAPCFVQVSVHVASRGSAVINEVAIASLPGDPRTEVDVDGDGLTLTHYCDGSKR